MLKAYATGFFSAVLAVLLVAVIWFGTQPKQEPGLLWGGTVYTSRQEFNGYLKSKGLSYKTFVARNPGAAPWEREEITVGAITVRASTEAREDWVVRLPLAAVGLMLATGCALLLLRGLRTVMPSLARGSVAFFSAVLTVLLVAVIWFGTQPRPEPGLLWGGTVYTSKQEFKGYLKSKGLSYKTWVARNPGAAPWEPATVRASTKARDDWVVRLLLAAIGLILATGCALLLLPGLRPVMARVARGSVAFFSPRGLRIGKTSAGRPTAFASIRRLGVVASGATRRLKVPVPLYAERLIGAARADGRLLPKLMRERNLGVGEWGYVLLALMTAGMFVLFVVLLLSA